MLVIKYRMSPFSPRGLLEEDLLCAVCPLMFREERVLLSFGGKLFEALSRGSAGMLLNKNVGFRCSEIVCNAI